MIALSDAVSSGSNRVNSPTKESARRARSRACGDPGSVSFSSSASLMSSIHRSPKRTPEPVDQSGCRAFNLSLFICFAHSALNSGLSSKFVIRVSLISATKSSSGSVLPSAMCFPHQRQRAVRLSLVMHELLFLQGKQLIERDRVAPDQSCDLREFQSDAL